MTRILTLIRGLPGSGKTTLARRLVPAHLTVAADDYMVNDLGEYEFDPMRLSECHGRCQDRVISLMQTAHSKIVVHNTFTQAWEIEPYFKIAEKYRYKIRLISVFDSGLSDEELFNRNLHGVPKHTIALSRERYQHKIDIPEGVFHPGWNL